MTRAGNQARTAWRSAAAFAALILAADTTWAQPKFDIQPTLDCLEQQGHDGDRRQCIGVAAGVCMEANMSTPAMSYCLEQELNWWDAALNDTYKQARVAAKQADTENAAPNNVQDSSLRDMQRAWIAYRDARCEWEASLWGGGTGAGPAFVGCLMTMTGEQEILIGINGLGQ